MTNIILKIYYGMLAVVIARFGWGFTNNNLSDPNFISFSYWMNFLEINYHFLYLSMFLLTFFLSLVGVIVKTNPLVRTLISFFVLVTVSMNYSFGSISHPNHMWMWSSIIVIFVKGDKSLEKNEMPFNFLFATIFSSYFISGLWKLKVIAQYSEGISSYFSFAGKMGLEAISYSKGEGNGANDWLMSLVSEHLYVIYFGFLGLILFQLSAFLPIIYSKLKGYYVIGGISFHIVAGVTTGNWYSQNVTVLIFLLLYLELMKYEKSILISQREIVTAKIS